MAVDRFYTKPPQAVDGSIAFAIDVNGINDETYLAFTGVASELDGQIAAVSAWTSLAQKWAENPENTEVTVGSYSALHWAAKAEADATTTHADVVLTNADAIATAADRVQTGLDRAATAADLIATNQDTLDTAADLIATNQDTLDTAADAIATAADRVQTGLDRAATAADLIATNQDTLDTAADLALTNADVATTHADVVLTHADVVLTNAKYDEFDDRYLGAKAADPTLDNDGNALIQGALYFNTSPGNMRVYDGSAWVTAYSYTTPNPFDELNILAQIQAVSLSF